MKKKLQIFISSTYEDMTQERQAALEAILKAGHIPAGMELFVAGGQPQVEIVRRWIDESDVYMLILGGRYGSIESTSGISYTEIEYDYAVSIGKPIFAIVIKDEYLEAKVKAIGSKVIEKNNPKELQTFKSKVLSKISTFYSDLKDIKLSIHETLAELTRENQFVGWVRSNEVPDSTSLLQEISRLTEERDKLMEALRSSEQRIESANSQNKQNKFDEEFKNLEEILKKIVIKTTLFSKDNTETEHSLLAWLKVFRETLVLGINNKLGMSERDRLLYFTVCPKLQIHGLAQSEKVSGVQWRRYTLTPYALKFLAYLDRIALLEDSDIKASSKPIKKKKAKIKKN